MLRDEVSREQLALTDAVWSIVREKGSSNSVIQIARLEPDVVLQLAERAECWPARQY